eukprot:4692152-Amphidinium_carterae.1
MNDHDARQATLLNQTMDEFSTSLNSCISQLTIELQQAESSTGTVVTKLRTAMEKKHSLVARRRGTALAGRKAKVGVDERAPQQRR